MKVKFRIDVIVRSILIVTLILAASTSSVCLPDVDEAQAIAEKIDNLYRSRTSYSEVEMEIDTAHWTRVLKMKVWTQGTDKTFVRLLEPQKERGIGTLRIGNEMWNFLPRVNKVMKIPPSMMMSSWMGSDFTNDDLVREFTLLKDYDFRLVSPEDAQADMHYLEAIPKAGVPVVWSRVLVAVHRDDLIPVWEKYLDGKNQLIRTMRFSKITRFGDRQVPALAELEPANKPGQKTILRYTLIEFDRPIDDNIMTLRNLRSGY